MICNTFMHLSNTPQLSFLFVLKQNKQKDTYKAYEQDLSPVSTILRWWFKCECASKHEVFYPSINIEWKTSPKHKIVSYNSNHKHNLYMNHT